MARTAHLVFLLLALPVLAGTRLRTPDEEALKAFRLTSENVRKAAAATRRIAAEVAKDPAFARSTQYNERKHAQTLDAKAKALEREPRLASALRAESITAREYVMVHVTALQAGLIAAMKARGVDIELADLREAINPANVVFVEKHRSEMDELGRSQEELRKVSNPGQDAGK